MNHELVHTKYDEPLGKWNIRIRRSVPDSDPEEFEDTADIVFNCTGCLSRWKWPDIPGLDNFKGRLLHTANWGINENPLEDPVPKDWSEKRVGVIGAVRFSSCLMIMGLRDTLLRRLHLTGFFGSANRSCITT
jgi:cation diffusion facilitator CzcD-associated flavoprotein CzcO